MKKTNVYETTESIEKEINEVSDKKIVLQKAKIQYNTLKFTREEIETFMRVGQALATAAGIRYEDTNYSLEIFKDGSISFNDSDNDYTWYSGRYLDPIETPTHVDALVEWMENA